MSAAGSKRAGSGVIEFLCSRGIRINAQNRYGQTALMIAASRQNPSAVQSLIKAGADANVRDGLGRTALSYASSPRRNTVATRKVTELIRKATTKE